MKVLAIAPHTDDVELGCGATLHKWIKYRGARVHYLALSSCNTKGIEDECMEACATLGIQSVEICKFQRRILEANRQAVLSTLIRVREQQQPTIVLCPCSSDIHQDHKTVYEECRRAFRDCTILGYELPWNCQNFTPQMFSPLAKIHINTKVAAVDKYVTQSHRQYTQPEYILGLSHVRGLQCGYPNAEAFEVIKWIDL